MNKTQNYQLNQWEAGDRVLHADFNADNAKIDAAIKAVDSRVDALNSAKADRAEVQALEIRRIVAGSYSGSGAASRNIELGFAPRAVLVNDSNGTMRYEEDINAQFFGGLAVRGGGLYTNGRGSSQGVKPVLTLTDTGFTVYSDISETVNSPRTNTGGKRYYYIAFE